MKSSPTAVALDGAHVDDRWGFDLLAPDGAPRAWIQDWDQPAPGFGVSEEEAGIALAYEIPETSAVSGDVVLATHSLFTKLYWHTTMGVIEAESDPEAAINIARRVGATLGQRRWEDLQSAKGRRPGLEQIAWHLDAHHLASGSFNKVYTWWDGVKVVSCARDEAVWPPTGLEATAHYWRAMMEAETAGSMNAEDDLLAAVFVDHNDAGEVARLVHVWTYDAAAMSNAVAAMSGGMSESMGTELADRGITV